MRTVPVRLKPENIPADFEVRPLGDDENPPGRTTDGTCGLSWDDNIQTGWTPVPSARCPFEYFHRTEEVRTPINLYATTAQHTGRDAVYTAAECLAAAVFAFNATAADAGGNWSDPTYRPFAFATGASNQAPASPLRFTYDALDGVWRELAAIDGFRGDDIRWIAEKAHDICHDLMGESDPARRAYEYARDEVFTEAHETARAEYEDSLTA